MLLVAFIQLMHETAKGTLERREILWRDPRSLATHCAAMRSREIAETGDQQSATGDIQWGNTE